ncbi:MAG: hypothetical protein PHV59_06060, partial [Victivallales bacterium]|nr:hypothetical protein [Victivallales bacterium]
RKRKTENLIRLHNCRDYLKTKNAGSRFKRPPNKPPALPEVIDLLWGTMVKINGKINQPEKSQNFFGGSNFCKLNKYLKLKRAWPATQERFRASRDQRFAAGPRPGQALDDEKILRIFRDFKNVFVIEV